ncbi:hypothetical protein PR048_010652 [Dryococelus australis]|uniref:Uncharacterized protein n=1 Tax=Dryococelus australis TaxID=614101 RepID=A0ABQ9I3B2_9NEOP|nr:hypothetical protein PR048_010652 [Dryococelus australis]
MTCRLDAIVLCTNIPISTAHWLSAVAVEDDNWTPFSRGCHTPCGPMAKVSTDWLCKALVTDLVPDWQAHSAKFILFIGIGKFREFNDLQARLLSPVPTGASTVCSLTCRLDSSVLCTPQSSAYWSLSCVFIGCCPTPGSHGIRKVFPYKFATGSEACRMDLINCGPIADRYGYNTYCRGRGGLVVKLLASHLGEPAGFLGVITLPTPLQSSAAPFSPHFTIVGSQDLDVKSRPNLSTTPHCILPPARVKSGCGQSQCTTLAINVMSWHVDAGTRGGPQLEPRHDAAWWWLVSLGQGVLGSHASHVPSRAGQGIGTATFVLLSITSEALVVGGGGWWAYVTGNADHYTEASTPCTAAGDMGGGRGAENPLDFCYGRLSHTPYHFVL